jgi:TolB-like protein
LAEGLSEEIVTGLSRFSYLRVMARGSIAKYSSESGDIRDIGNELGARYVMEGSLRQEGSKLRLAVQLADAIVARRTRAARRLHGRRSIRESATHGQRRAAQQK